MVNPEELLASTLACAGCGGAQWTVARAEPECAIVCGACGARHVLRDGILHSDADMHPEARQERASVAAIETNALLGGWREKLSFDRVDPDLLRAYLSLPYGDASFRFDEPGYFTNVQRFAPEFDFLVSEIQARVPAGRLLDIGADGTWSTARLSEKGFSCVALDITDHLRMAHLYQRVYPPYALVNADMHAPIFRDECFDAITAINALHHSNRLPELVSNIARILRPGGVLGIIEPYVQNEVQRTVFGASQSESGINENVYALEHWCRVLSDTGLMLVVYSISDSFNAVFVKTPTRQSTIAPEQFQDGFGNLFYRSVITVAPTATTVTLGRPCTFSVNVANHGCAAWASRGPLPIRLSYHVSRHTLNGREVVRFDNPRTSLSSFVRVGSSWAADVSIGIPDEGVYEVEFDLVHEARSWFKDRGGQVASARVTVVPDSIRR